MNEKFALTEHEKLSPHWLKLKAHLEERLQFYREVNDNDASQERTDKTRGRIAMLKDLIRLGDKSET